MSSTWAHAREALAMTEKRCLCGCGAIAPNHRVSSWKDERDPDMSNQTAEPSPTPERDPKEVRRLASEARHEALRLLREQFPMMYAELHRAALEARGLGKGK